MQFYIIFEMFYGANNDSDILPTGKNRFEIGRRICY